MTQSEHVLASKAKNYFSVEQLSVGYESRILLADVNFQLSKGSIGCLLGPSGCGKSTLLRAIAGFEQSLQGRIYLDDHWLNRPGRTVAAEHRNIGMVFQDYSLFPHLSALENVRFGLYGLSRPNAIAKARHWLGQVGLANKEKAMPHELSGGEQQRVALARALAPEPELVLLDEPFSSLDLEFREKLSREVRELFKASNTTALMVTHDQHEAFAMADYIGVINNNRLEQWDDAYHVYHQPVNQSVADFVGQGVFLKGEIVADDAVKTALGELSIGEDYLQASVFSLGDIVQVLMRPDDIIHDDASAMQARVVARYFRGADFIYTLAIPGGEEVLALVPSHHDHAIGENIGICLEIDHVVVFPNV